MRYGTKIRCVGHLMQEKGDFKGAKEAYEKAMGAFQVQPGDQYLPQISGLLEDMDRLKRDQKLDLESIL